MSTYAEEEAAKIKSVLTAAATYLEQFGWQKFQLGWDGGPRCILGALSSGGAWRLSNTSISDLEERLHMAIGTDAPAAWNDQQDRTKEDVINALRKAAEL